MPAPEHHFLLAHPTPAALSHAVPRPLIYTLLILVTASWGAVLPIFRYVNAVREPLGVTAWDIVWLRLVPGALCFLPVLLMHRSTVRTLIRESGLALILVGLCTTSLYNFFLVAGEERVPASIASLIIGVNPSVTFLLSVVFLGERATGLKLTGIALSLSGLYYISQSEAAPGQSPPDLYYLGLTILAPVVFSVGTVVAKRMLRNVRPLTMTACTVTAGAAPLLPLPFLQGNLAGALPGLPWSFWASIAFLVLVPLVFGYYIWYLALDHIDAGQVSTFIFLVPVFGVALSSFSERPSWSSLTGGAVILAGVLMTNWNISYGTKRGSSG